MKKDYECQNNTGVPFCEKGVSRRDFIRTAAVGAMGAAFAGSQAGCSSDVMPLRQGLGNLFMEDDKPLLVVVEGEDLKKMLETGLDAIGGIEKLVSGKTVVMKPNLVSSQPPPVTTDVEMVLAVGEQAGRAGASALTACDACGTGVQRMDKFNRLDYTARLKDTNIAVSAVDFNIRTDHVFVNNQAWTSHPTIGVVKTLYDADVILNLPMIKRHGGARFTCALKNHFGSVHFPLRQIAHGKRNSKTEDGKRFFDHALVEYADSARSELNIVDGRSLLIRGGPSLRGSAEVKPGVNRIILCGDMVATDAYCSQLMAEHDETYSTDMITYQLESAEKLGLGVKDLDNVVIKEIIA